MALYGARSTLPMFSSAVLQTGDVESFSYFRLAALGYRFDGALLALLRPVVPYTLALSVARSAGSSIGGIPTSAPLLALSTGPMISLLFSGR